MGSQQNSPAHNRDIKGAFPFDSRLEGTPEQADGARKRTFQPVPVETIPPALKAEYMAGLARAESSDYERRRFWSKVDVRRPGECWPWEGATQRRNYGAFWDSARGALVSAHRKAWELEHGLAVPDDLVVMHRCDSPSCVNPSHLVLGSQGDNVRDCVKKGRGNRPRGNAHHRGPRLKAEQVASMRVDREDGATLSELARKYGVTVSTASDIINRKTWKHITPAEAQP